MYICVPESLHCTPETNTTLSTNYTPTKKGEVITELKKEFGDINSFDLFYGKVDESLGSLWNGQ